MCVYGVHTDTISPPVCKNSLTSIYMQYYIRTSHIHMYIRSYYVSNFTVLTQYNEYLHMRVHTV